jgi:hypothetical protein
MLTPAKSWQSGRTITTRSDHIVASAISHRRSMPHSALPRCNGTGRCATPRAPRPIPLHHRAIKAQINPGLYPSLDERRESLRKRLWASSNCCAASDHKRPTLNGLPSIGFLKTPRRRWQASTSCQRRERAIGKSPPVHAGGFFFCPKRNGPRAETGAASDRHPIRAGVGDVGRPHLLGSRFMS